METIIWFGLIAILAGFLWFVVWLMKRTGNA
jgi:hypothetical protein